MSKFAKFMRANKVIKENEKHAVTKSLCDENGKPLLLSSYLVDGRYRDIPATQIWKPPERQRTLMEIILCNYLSVQ